MVGADGFYGVGSSGEGADLGGCVPMFAAKLEKSLAREILAKSWQLERG